MFARIARPLARLLSSDVAVVAGGQLVQQALTILTGVAIGRMLGAGAYGLVNIARNILTPMTIVAPLGLDLALLKHVGRADGDLARTDRIVGRLRLIVLAINLPIALLGGVFAGGWLMVHVYRFPSFNVILMITLLALPIAADLSVLSAYYRGRHRPGSFALMTLYVQPVARVILVSLAFFFAPNAIAIVAINTLQIAISGIFVWTHLGRWRAKDGIVRRVRATADQARGEWAEVRTILTDSTWMGVNLFVYGMMRFVDILVLGAFVPAKVVGSYAALSTVAQLVQVWPMAASQTLGPTVSKRYHAGDVAGVRQAINDYINFAAIVSSFLFAGVAVFGDRLDLVFGHSFTFQSDIAFLMSLGYLLSATLAPIGYSLSMTGRHRAELVILAAGGLVLVISCYLLVPRFGAIGAASSVCLTFALINITRFVYVARTLGFIAGKPENLVPPLLALACAFAAKLAMEAAFPRSFVEVLAACVIYTGLYGGITFAFVLDAEQKRKILARAH